MTPNADYERVINEAETTIRWLLNGHPDARAQALSWLAAYGAQIGESPNVHFDRAIERVLHSVLDNDETADLIEMLRSDPDAVMAVLYDRFAVPLPPNGSKGTP